MVRSSIRFFAAASLWGALLLPATARTQESQEKVSPPDLSACEPKLSTDPTPFESGDAINFQVDVDCGEATPEGVGVQVLFDGADGRSLAADVDDVRLDGIPILLDGDEFRGRPGCYVVRLAVGDQVREKRLCTASSTLSLPMARHRIPRRTTEEASSPLPRCDVLGIRGNDPAPFAVGEEIDFDIVFVCPAAVVRLEVALDRDTREGSKAIGSQRTSLRKGINHVTIPGDGYRAGPDCFRVRATRGPDRIESRFCARPSALTLARPRDLEPSL